MRGLDEIRNRKALAYIDCGFHRTASHRKSNPSSLFPRMASSWTGDGYPPLTTTFTPPSGCDHRQWRVSTNSNSSTLTISGNETVISSTVSILTWLESASAPCTPWTGANVGRHSPGLICPVGWTVVRTAMATNYGKSVARDMPETELNCCPRYDSSFTTVDISGIATCRAIKSIIAYAIAAASHSTLGTVVRSGRLVPALCCPQSPPSSPASQHFLRLPLTRPY
jgi:hypothetical protein